MNELRSIELDWYIISDTHFLHNNIIRYQNRPENHDWLMLKAWNDTIKDGDFVLHLGDLALGKKPEMARILKQLKGNKFLIPGNHDRESDNYYRNYGFIPILPAYRFFDTHTLVFFSHRPDPAFDGHKRIGINIHGHIHHNVNELWKPKHPERYINVSAEVVNYTPVRIGDLLKRG